MALSTSSSVVSSQQWVASRVLCVVRWSYLLASTALQESEVST